MTYNLPLGTPLAGTKKEILKLVKELNLKPKPVKPFLRSFRRHYIVNVSECFDSAKFNGVSKDICFAYILYKNSEDDDYAVAMFLEYHEENSYEDIATMLEYIIHYIDLTNLPNIEASIEDDI